MNETYSWKVKFPSRVHQCKWKLSEVSDVGTSEGDARIKQKVFCSFSSLLPFDSTEGTSLMNLIPLLTTEIDLNDWKLNS